MDPHDQFGMGSYLVMYLGQNVPHLNPYQPGQRELAVMQKWRQHRIAEAADAAHPRRKHLPSFAAPTGDGHRDFNDMQ